MNKLLFLFIGIILLILVSVVLFVLPKKPGVIPPKPVEQFQPSGTTSPTPTPATQVLSVISSIPSMNTQDVPPNITLRITFNKEPRLELTSVKFTPAVVFQLSLVYNILFIDPTIDLLPSTNYKVEVSVNGMISPYILMFRTASQNPPGTAPDAESLKKQDEILRQMKPDAYLANKLPFSTNDFSASSAIKPSTNNLYFIVELKGSDKVSAKNAFLDWLKSLQLTDTQIQGLGIEYQ